MKSIQMCGSIDEQITLDRIETCMRKYTTVKKPFRAGFVFPNGSVCFIRVDHYTTAKKVAESLKMNCNNIDPMYYFLSLGIMRIRNNGTLAVEGITRPNNAIEKTILDFAAGQGYDMVAIDFGPQYYRQAEFLRKKLEKGRF